MAGNIRIRQTPVPEAPMKHFFSSFYLPGRCRTQIIAPPDANCVAARTAAQRDRFFRHKSEVAVIALKELSTAQLPAVPFAPADLPEPEPGDIEKRCTQQQEEKFGKTYTHFSYISRFLFCGYQTEYTPGTNRSDNARFRAY